MTTESVEHLLCTSGHPKVSDRSRDVRTGSGPRRKSQTGTPGPGPSEGPGPVHRWVKELEEGLVLCEKFRVRPRLEEGHYEPLLFRKVEGSEREKPPYSRTLQ